MPCPRTLNFSSGMFRGNILQGAVVSPLPEGYCLEGSWRSLCLVRQMLQGGAPLTRNCWSSFSSVDDWLGYAKKDGEQMAASIEKTLNWCLVSMVPPAQRTPWRWLLRSSWIWGRWRSITKGTALCWTATSVIFRWIFSWIKSWAWWDGFVGWPNVLSFKSWSELLVSVDMCWSESIKRCIWLFWAVVFMFLNRSRRAPSSMAMYVSQIWDNFGTSDQVRRGQVSFCVFSSAWCNGFCTTRTQGPLHVATQLISSDCQDMAIRFYHVRIPLQPR